MDGPSTVRRSTRVSRHLDAPRRDVYAAFVEPEKLAAWLPPAGMRGVVHEFEPRVGGRLRMTLTYADPAAGPGGKTTGESDVFNGRFGDLVPGERVVWLVEFESENAAFAGEMRVSWALADEDGGTIVTVACDDVPPGIRLADNEAGSASSLENLARLVERS